MTGLVVFVALIARASLTEVCPRKGLIAHARLCPPANQLVLAAHDKKDPCLAAQPNSKTRSLKRIDQQHARANKVSHVAGHYRHSVLKRGGGNHGITVRARVWHMHRRA